MKDIITFVIFASMKLKRLITCFLFLLLVTSCKESKELLDTLKRAEAVMEATPDSAYTLLQNLDTEKLKTREGRARYALLYTQAQDKCYIDETNDSLITTAVNYYRHHGEVRNRFLSLYYKGRVHSNTRDYLKAMLAYAEAETLVPDMKDDYYRGLLYTQLGDVYKEYFDYPKSLEAYWKASAYYYATDKKLHYLYSLVDQSTIYRNLNDYNKSDSLLQIVLRDAEPNENASLINLVLGNLIMQYVEQGRIQEAKSIYEKLRTEYKFKNKTVDFMASVAKIYLSEGRILDAEEMLLKAWNKVETTNDSIACFFVASQINKTKGEAVKALQEQEAGILMQNRLVKENLQQPVLTMQRDYLAQEVEHQAYKRKMNRLFSIILIAFIILLALIIGYYLQKRLRKYYRENLHRRLQQQEAENRRKIELLWKEAMQREYTIRQCLKDLNREMQHKDEASLQSIRNLQEEIRLRDETVHFHQQRFKHFTDTLEKDKEQLKKNRFLLFRAYFRTLDDLFIACSHEYVNEKFKYKGIEETLKKLVEPYTQNKKGHQLLERNVNEYMDNVMTHFRAEIKLSDEEYYRQICFLFAGFSYKSVAYIFHCTPNTIYKRVDRAVAKIKDAPSLNTDLYLKLLSK